MENLTHSLFGWLLSRAGFDRLGGWTPPVMIVAANLPDFEILLDPFASKPEYLLHHRGLSHSLAGLAVLSIGAALLVWAGGRLLKKRIHQPPRFFSALLACGVAVFSHLLLDWLNTYGVQPLLPFNERRFYGDMAFIADPWMWLLLGGAIFAGSRRSRLARNIFLFLAACTTAIMVQTLRLGIIPPGALIAWIAGLALWVILRVRVFGSQPASTPARAGLLAWTAYLALLFVCNRLSVSRAREALVASKPPPAAYRLASSPAPAVPWRWEVIAYSPHNAEVIGVDLLRGTAARSKQLDPGLDHPGLAMIADTLEYAAWKNFARFPIVTKKGGALALGDLRYRLFDRPFAVGTNDWSELTVPLPSSSLLPRE